MRALTFLVRTFSWQPFSQTWPDAPPAHPGEVSEALVAFIQVEEKDMEDRARAFRRLLKHLKWLANKKKFQNIVLHSFTHLGGESAPAEFAQQFLLDMAQRLEKTGYHVSITPFGYFCSWQLDVYGESLAKVYKEM